MEKVSESIKRLIARAAENQTPYQEPMSTAQNWTISVEKEKSRFYQAMLAVEPNFDIKKADKRIIRSVFAWVWQLKELNELGLDFSKGLFFYGSIGRGKTMTLRALRSYLISVNSRYRHIRQQDYRLGTYWKSASELANMYAADGQTALTEYYQRSCCLFIDELGREPNPANNFGTKLDVIQFLLQMRYDIRRSSVTHITTNLSLEQIASVYGNYIADRCLELFNFVEFSGESIRR